MCVYVCKCVYMCVYTHVCIHVYVCTHVHICMCVYVYIYVYIYIHTDTQWNTLQLLKREIITTCSNMNGPRDYHTKSQRERQIPYGINYMWNLKYNTN